MGKAHTHTILNGRRKNLSQNSTICLFSMAKEFYQRNKNTQTPILINVHRGSKRYLSIYIFFPFSFLLLDWWHDSNLNLIEILCSWRNWIFYGVVKIKTINKMIALNDRKKLPLNQYAEYVVKRSKFWLLAFYIGILFDEMQTKKQPQNKTPIHRKP